MTPHLWQSWIELLEVPGLGPRYWHRLLSVFGTPETVLSATLHQLKTAIPDRVAKAIVEQRQKQQSAIQETLERTQQWLNEAPNRLILTWADEHYPSSLLELPDPPPVIFYQGNVDLLKRPSLAIVGGRNATPQGCRDAEAWAEVLAADLTIISGMALGIDAAAHRGALTQKASTIAVIATGIDRVYPSQHRDLAHQIAEKGGLLSEFPLGTPAKSPHFPRRNRIISGLSQGCLVVEATLNSGSLITAKLAAEQGRDVFAIPGSIHSPLSKGCHQLIKEGAKLVESAEDVLEELRGLRPIQKTSPRRTRSHSRSDDLHSPIAHSLPSSPSSALVGHIAESILNDPLWLALGYEAVDVDTLCVRTGWAVEQLNMRLLEFELEGYIAALPGGCYQRIR